MNNILVLVYANTRTQLMLKEDNMKLCIVYNFTQKYREPIFKKLDREFDCKWYFGNNKTNIAGFDISVLKDATLIKNHYSNRTPFYSQEGIASLANNKEIDTFLTLGDPFNVSMWLLAIRIRLFNRKKKLYYWTHGWYGRENILRRLFKKLFFKLADGIFLYGNYAKELMIKEGFKENKLFVIHNSLDYNNQLKLRKSLTTSDIYSKHFGNNNKTIIFIGRLTKQKRIDMLLDVIANLKKKGESFNLVLIGDGSVRQALEKQANELEITEQVWFYGACYDDTKNAELIYNADLCVSPGNVGLTAVHTMTFGTPVATHDTFSMQGPEFEAIREGETGTFFKYNDKDSIEVSISGWFKQHSNDREQIRQNCYEEIATQWNPEFQMKVFKEILK